jgi:hypothetical protein
MCLKWSAKAWLDPCSAEYLIVPTLCVGMHPVTLRAQPLQRMQSVHGSLPTQSGNDLHDLV